MYPNSRSLLKKLSMLSAGSMFIVNTLAAQLTIPEEITIITSFDNDLPSIHPYAISSDGTVIVGSAGTGNTQILYAGVFGYFYREAASDGRQLTTPGLGGNWLDGRPDLFPNIDLNINPRTSEAFRWTRAGDTIELDQIEPNSTYQLNSARALSADGSVIVGTTDGEAYKWTQETGLVELLGADDSNSSASDVSADGLVIVGTVAVGFSLPPYGGYSVSGTVLYANEAFRWTQESGMIGLGIGSEANAVSADGSVVVGQNGYEAFRWTHESGMIGLVDPADDIFLSNANDVSANGSVIVGTGVSESRGTEAFRWTQETGMVGLGDLAGGDFSSNAIATSANGSVVVGHSNSTNGFEAYRWTETDGMQTINQWLADSEITTDLIFTHVSDISGDGSVVVGIADLGDNVSKAFLARGGSGAITLDEFTQTFGTTASVPQTSLALPSTVLNGAHHRVLLTQNFVDQDQMVWVNGDFADHDRRDAEIVVGEVGMAHDFKPGLRGGFGVGYGALDQDLTYDGEHELDGQFIMGELDWQIPETSIILSFTGIYGDWNADIDRGYDNGGTNDTSSGDTDVTTLTGRLRADWVDAFKLLGFSFTPRIAYTITQIDTDSYTETGGGFPAHFDSMSHTSNEVRFGLTGEKALNEKTTVRGILEAVHRFDEDNDDFSGEVIGLFPFSIEGAENEQTWARVGAEISHRICDNMLLTATVFTSSEGEDAKFSGALNLQYLF